MYIFKKTLKNKIFIVSVSKIVTCRPSVIVTDQDIDFTKSSQITAAKEFNPDDMVLKLKFLQIFKIFQSFHSIFCLKPNICKH